MCKAASPWSSAISPNWRCVFLDTADYPSRHCIENTKHVFGLPLLCVLVLIKLCVRTVESHHTAYATTESRHHPVAHNQYTYHLEPTSNGTNKHTLTNPIFATTQSAAFRTEQTDLLLRAVVKCVTSERSLENGVANTASIQLSC